MKHRVRHRPYQYRARQLIASKTQYQLKDENKDNKKKTPILLRFPHWPTSSVISSRGMLPKNYGGLLVDLKKYTDYSRYG